MTKQQVIDILENFRPSRDKFCPSPVDDYVDDMIDSRIDSIIEFVKREPDNEWIKCSERLPEEGKDVLFIQKTWGNNIEFKIGDFDSKMKWWQAGSGVIKNEYVTHWMPLPEPPKEESR